MTFLRRWGWLLALLLLAASLRFYALETNPCGLFRDEVRKAYSTYSLLTTGRDLTGRAWPLQIKEFSAYTTPLYHWFSLPFIAAGGLSPLAARCVAALAGSLACVAVAMLASRWKGQAAGVLAGSILAISPWHLLFSRWANQGILMTAFIPLALFATWRAAEFARDPAKPAWGWIAAASVAWGLAWNAYEPARVFVPLFLLALIAIELLARPANRKAAVSLFLIGLGTLVVISPFLVSMAMNWEETRLRFAAIQGETPLSVAGFLKNYAFHWNPVYLLATGDANPRHHITGQGQITLFEATGIVLGIWALYQSKARWSLWLVAWLVLAPVPAALTSEGLPHALRTLMIVPAFALLAGVGFAQLFDWTGVLRRPLVAAGFAFAFAAQTAVTVTLFFSVYPEKSAPHWDKGFYEGVSKAAEVRKAGEVCVVSGLVEFPEAMVEFVTEADPSGRQAGQPIEGFVFLPTGKPINPAEHRNAALFLVRPGETRQPPWWKEVEFFTGEDAVLSNWRLYSSTGSGAP